MMAYDNPELTYSDLLTDEDEGLLDLVERLEIVYAAKPPPAEFLDQTAALLVSPPQRMEPRMPRGALALPRRLGSHRVVAGAVLLAAALFLAGAVGYTTHSFINVFPPGKQPGSNVVLVTNSPPPLGAQHFRSLDPTLAARESGLPIAFLSEVPKSLKGSVGTQIFLPFFLPSKESARGPRVFAGAWTERIRSLVRYEGRREMLVALFQLAPWVKKAPVLLGERAVHLPNGKSVWVNVMPESLDFNWLTVIKGRYLVTLYSNESLRTIERAAATATVATPASSGFHGIPAGWPPPGPAPASPPGVDIMLVGKVNIDWRSSSPHLTYSFAFGNAGSATERFLRFTLVMPQGVSLPASGARRNRTIFIGQGNGGFAGSDEVTVSRARRPRFMVVRATWRAGARVEHRAFHFRFSSHPVHA